MRMATQNNIVLSAVMRQVRARRPPLPLSQPYFTRVERVPAGNYVEIWFLTTGCTWDGSGGCTMCNYGAGPPVPAEAMVDAVREAVAEVRVEPHELMISPSGGMWDKHEVTEAAVREMYVLARAANPGKFMVETRAETVSGARLAEMQEALPGVRLAVEVGLESHSDAVLRYCVVEIAWYKSYYDTEAKIRRSPVGCASCTQWLVHGLDRYRATQDFTVVRELIDRRCECAGTPSALTTIDGDLPERVWRLHALLAETCDLGQLWARYGDRYRSEIRRAFDSSPTATVASGV